MLTAYSGKRNVTVWRPSVRLSVCLSRRHTHRDSPRSSMRRGQRTFRPDNKEDQHTCSIVQETIVVSEELVRLPSKRCTGTDPCWHLRHNWTSRLLRILLLWTTTKMELLLLVATDCHPCACFCPPSVSC